MLSALLRRTCSKGLRSLACFHAMEILRAAAAMRSSSLLFAYFGLCIKRIDAIILQSAAKACKARQSDAAPLKRLSLSFGGWSGVMDMSPKPGRR